ncbi:MAG: hypothetical protein E6G13_01555 [Actinobacteria bacterium]|nr:MAG: hypothetical protein E6G13_01555 [Actinomycetota bacterium]
MALLVRIVLAAILVAAAAAKARPLRTSASALATYGVAEPLRVPATLLLITTEAALAVGVAAGIDGAAYVAGGLLAAFAVLLAVEILRGRSGQPCGCFGAGSRVGLAAILGRDRPGVLVRVHRRSRRRRARARAGGRGPAPTPAHRVGTRHRRGGTAARLARLDPGQPGALRSRRADAGDLRVGRVSALSGARAGRRGVPPGSAGRGRRIRRDSRRGRVASPRHPRESLCGRTRRRRPCPCERNVQQLRPARGDPRDRRAQRCRGRPCLTSPR